jgi:catechol 2,3-dioxygenase-like lactoylglutathione lyase family enzyme
MKSKDELGVMGQAVAVISIIFLLRPGSRIIGQRCAKCYNNQKENRWERSGMMIDRLDHLVLTVRNLEETCAFYSAVLGMRVVRSENGRVALHFGKQKINLHLLGSEFEPKAQHVAPGSADLCFITEIPIRQAIEHVNSCNAEIIEGPVIRQGALGKIESIYLRDPDGNLVEISHYV